jgi:hypothetical protein
MADLGADVPTPVERAATALERIAAALERSAEVGEQQLAQGQAMNDAMSAFGMVARGPQNG